jgi:hypothetical protein
MRCAVRAAADHEKIMTRDRPWVISPVRRVRRCRRCCPAVPPRRRCGPTRATRRRPRRGRGPAPVGIQAAPRTVARPRPRVPRRSWRSRHRLAGEVEVEAPRSLPAGVPRV